MRPLNRLLSRRLPVEQILLLLVIVVAFALRLNGLNWDAGYGFHPDERSLYLRAGCMYDLLTERPGYESCLAEHPQIQPGIPGITTLLDFDRSPLNPRWFPLGSILIYVLVLARSGIELFTDIGALDMRYVGRSLSALADVGSVALVYVLGRRLYGRLYGPWVGLLAASLVAFAVIHVQHSHFYRPETFTALLVLAVFWAMLRMLELRRLRDSLLLGLLVGLAFTPKVSILPLGIPLALAYYFRLVDGGGGRISGLPRGAIEQTSLHCLAALAVALGVFFLVTPYALLDLSNFLGEQAAQAEMARNAGFWPFTIQYVGTPAFLYQFSQTGVWGLGPVLAIAAWSAIVFTAVWAWQGSFARRGDLLILAWLVPSILFLETFEVRFQRYYFALVPFMLLLCSRMLLWGPFFLQSWPGSLQRSGEGRDRRAGRAVSNANRIITQSWNYLRFNPSGRLYITWAAWSVVALVVATSLLYSLAFQRIYLNPHPAVAASQWLNRAAPDGARIVSDNHWDEYVPELHNFQVWQFPAYDADNVAKMAELGKRLADADYLVFYSHRPYVSVASDPQRFPLSGEYYSRLFAGDLGYVLEREFTSGPGLAGVEISDDPFDRTPFTHPTPEIEGDTSWLTLNWGYADDNVVGYDHPATLVFRNQDKLPPEAIIGILVQGAGKPPDNLKFSEEEWQKQRAGGTWSDLFSRESLANQVPVLAWLLVVELIYLAALPFCLFLFRPLADRGMILARGVGLLAAAYVTWLTVSLGVMEFSVLSIAVGLLAVLAISGVALAAYFQQMVQFLGARWRLLLTGEAIFLGAFLAFVVIRALNPDLWHPYRGGEKPMELAYFNAVLRSTIMPPYDPWFAGGYLNYYYWGYFLLAIPTRLAGVMPTVAFNLAAPLLFALTVTGAYSVVYNLAEGYRTSRRPARPRPAEIPELETDLGYAGDYRTGASGEDGPLKRAARSPITAGLLAGLFVAVIGNLDGIVQLAQGLWGRLADGAEAVLAFDFWRSSRMIPNLESVEPGLLAFWLWGRTDSPAEVSWHITEFPFFSFLFADLHAHMMAIPFTILVAGLGLNLLSGMRKLGLAWHCAAIAAAGVAVGALWAVNSWDYPAYLILLVALAAASAYLGWENNGHRLAWALGISACLVLVSLTAFLPFHLAVETFDTGIEATRWRTPLANFLGIHGLFLVIVGCFLLWQARRPLYIAAGATWNLQYLDVAVETDIRLRYFQRWLRYFLAGGLILVAFFALAGYWTVAALLVFFVLASLVAWDTVMSRDGGRGYALFPLLAAMLGLGLAAGVDLVRVEGDIGRMNTLFKYYLAVWVLLAMASAFFLWRMLYDSQFRSASLRGWRLALLGVVGLLVCGSLIYTFLGTNARVEDRFNELSPTLDGAAYMERAVHWEKEQAIELRWDAEAIRWLQEEVQGSPVILEAHTEQYRWGGRMANYTGLPTVLGWPWHQIQQRGPYSGEVHDRAADIRDIYETADVARAIDLLNKYEVRYVILGDLERVFYNPVNLGKFDIMVEQGLAVKAFDNGRTAIYRLER